MAVRSTPLATYRDLWTMPMMVYGESGEVSGVDYAIWSDDTSPVLQLLSPRHADGAQASRHGVASPLIKPWQIRCAAIRFPSGKEQTFPLCCINIVR